MTNTLTFSFLPCETRLLEAKAERLKALVYAEIVVLSSMMHLASLILSRTIFDSKSNLFFALNCRRMFCLPADSLSSRVEPVLPSMYFLFHSLRLVSETKWKPSTYLSSFDSKDQSWTKLTKVIFQIRYFLFTISVILELHYQSV